MRGIVETINEAKRMASMDDVELCCEFWDEWCGLNKNGNGGTSGNSRAQKLENEIWTRIGSNWDDKFMDGCWALDLDEIIKTRLGKKPKDNTRGSILRWAMDTASDAHRIIRNNIDIIRKGVTKTARDNWKID